MNYNNFHPNCRGRCCCETYLTRQQENTPYNYNYIPNYTHAITPQSSISNPPVCCNSPANIIHFKQNSPDVEFRDRILYDPNKPENFIEKTYSICGNNMNNHHHSLPNCDLYKGISEHTVQNSISNYNKDQSRLIDKEQKKRFPFYHFQNSIDIGKKPEVAQVNGKKGRKKLNTNHTKDHEQNVQVTKQNQTNSRILETTLNKENTKLPDNYTNSNSPLSNDQAISPNPFIPPSRSAQPNPTNAILNQKIKSILEKLPAVTTSPQNKNFNKFAKPSPFSYELPNFETNEGKVNDRDETYPPMIIDLIQSINDKEWQTSFFKFLQSQTSSPSPISTFELIFKNLDQNLFLLIDWVGKTISFNKLQMGDQITLIQNSWSSMIILDHLHQRIHNDLVDAIVLSNGQYFDLLHTGLLGESSLTRCFMKLQKELTELRFDKCDYVCVKLLLLLNPETKGIIDKQFLIERYDIIQSGLLEYSLYYYRNIKNKFNKLIKIIQAIHALAIGGEKHLYLQYYSSKVFEETLLMETLRAKNKQITT